MTAPPLAGVRVLELARILAGPWAGQLLGDLGAAAPLTDDPRFKTNASRVAHRDELAQALSAIFVQLPRDEVLARCVSAGVPAGGINTVAEVFEDPQVRARGLRKALAAPWAKGGVVPGVRTPIQFSRSGLADDRVSPLLGEHVDQILAELTRAAGEPTVD